LHRFNEFSKETSKMNKLSRRSFIGKGAMGLGATIAMGALPKELLAAANYADIPIGFQTWVVRDRLGKDFPGTLKAMSDSGFKIMELCSPQGYAQLGFGSLTSMKPAEIKKVINDAGLNCYSCHYGFKELTDNIDERIAFAKELGLTHMVCSTFWLPKTATIKDYQDHADQLNKSAEKIKKAGMQAGFHNHDMEFAKIDGQLIYDALLKQFDKDLVKMQFQTQVITLGYKAADYFKQYPDRFFSAHLSDWSADKKEKPIGQGVIDWKEFFAAAKAAGVKYYYVEMDPATFPDSVAYIKTV